MLGSSGTKEFDKARIKSRGKPSVQVEHTLHQTYKKAGLKVAKSFYDDKEVLPEILEWNEHLAYVADVRLCKPPRTPQLSVLCSSYMHIKSNDTLVIQIIGNGF